MKTNYNIIVILGATASGKTKLAATLAYTLNTEIISADSRQVFRNMNIGTGKDYDDYTINGSQVPYHLIDIVDAGNDYHIHQYMQDFYTAFQHISAQNKIPVFCGGSGMYIDAVLKGYEFTYVPVNETLRASLSSKTKEELLRLFHSLPQTSFTPLADVSTAKRLTRAIEISTYLHTYQHQTHNYPKLYPLVFGLDTGREIRRRNIELRLQQRLQNGLIEEVQSLLKKVPAEKLIRYGLEYKFVVMYLQGELTFNEMQTQLTIAIQQFARRQMTFFRKMEREGLPIHWLNSSLPLQEQLQTVLQIIHSNSKN